MYTYFVGAQSQAKASVVKCHALTFTQGTESGVLLHCMLTSLPTTYIV